eukprot:Platyproteum_vivax@DN5346_c0_g1_i3.p1
MNTHTGESSASRTRNVFDGAPWTPTDTQNSEISKNPAGRAVGKPSGLSRAFAKKFGNEKDVTVNDPAVLEIVDDELEGWAKNVPFEADCGIVPTEYPLRKAFRNVPCLPPSPGFQQFSSGYICCETEYCSQDHYLHMGDEGKRACAKLCLKTNNCHFMMVTRDSPCIHMEACRAHYSIDSPMDWSEVPIVYRRTVYGLGKPGPDPTIIVDHANELTTPQLCVSPPDETITEPSFEISINIYPALNDTIRDYVLSHTQITQSRVRLWTLTTVVCNVFNFDKEENIIIDGTIGMPISRIGRFQVTYMHVTIGI